MSALGVTARAADQSSLSKSATALSAQEMARVTLSLHHKIQLPLARANTKIPLMVTGVRAVAYACSLHNFVTECNSK